MSQGLNVAGRLREWLELYEPSNMFGAVTVLNVRDALAEIERLTAERDEAKRRNVLLLSKLQEYEVREL